MHLQLLNGSEIRHGPCSSINSLSFQKRSYHHSFGDNSLRPPHSPSARSHHSLAMAAENGSNGAVSMEGKPSFEKPRQISLTLNGMAHMEGPIVVRRMVGGPELKSFDPYIILDWSKVRKGKALPDHPHRGFEVLTYMEQGICSHEDFDGYDLTVEAGDVQWVTAGRGTVHSELPLSEGDTRGMQIWINLSKENKMIEPRFAVTKAKDVIKIEKDGVFVKVIAGKAFGVKAPEYFTTPFMFLDFVLQPGTAVHQKVPESFNTVIFVVEGEGVFGDEDAKPTMTNQAVTLSAGDGVSAWNKSDRPVRFFLTGAEPSREQIVKKGDIVMSSEAEIDEAYEDYRNCRNGFENAKTWKSRAMKLMEAAPSN